MRANTQHLTRKYTVPLALTLTLGTLLTGMLIGLLAGAGSGYGGLAVPALTPPDAVFPIVWAALYLTIGFSLFLMVHKQVFAPDLANARGTSIGLWVTQFLFNLCWMFAFFTFRLYAFSFVWLLALSAINLALIINCFFYNAPAAWLLIPYEAWLLFACYLNLYIAILN